MRESGISLYPVSVEWEPPFTMLTTLVGAGDRQAGADVAAVITAWGTWQPALSPNRRPSVSDALVGSLGGSKADSQARTPALLSLLHATHVRMHAHDHARAVGFGMWSSALQRAEVDEPVSLRTLRTRRHLKDPYVLRCRSPVSTASPTSA